VDRESFHASPTVTNFGEAPLVFSYVFFSQPLQSMSMEWIDSFDLFLFDFDGLLVDTEILHLRAYQMMCEQRGYTLPWDLDQFFQKAHGSAIGIREGIKALFPGMFERGVTWDVLYAEKKQFYEALLFTGNLTLLPGVEPLLKELARKNKKRCVVTNSTLRQIELIRSQIAVLNTIPRWVTRESYENPKPAPDGYLTALRELKSEGDRVIGFEDSMRGYDSLKAAGVETAVLICPPSHPQLEQCPALRGHCVSSFEEVSSVLPQLD
jgi:beta-phosphoglucomutase